MNRGVLAIKTQAHSSDMISETFLKTVFSSVKNSSTVRSAVKLHHMHTDMQYSSGIIMTSQ